MTDSQPLTGDEPHTRECLDVGSRAELRRPAEESRRMNDTCRTLTTTTDYWGTIARLSFPRACNLPKGHTGEHLHRVKGART
jgi:hypothetical protein